MTLQLTKDINLASLKENFFTPMLKYSPAHVLAKNLKISSVLIKRITGSMLLFDNSNEASGELKRLDVGLNMKYPKQNREVIIHFS